MYEALCPKDEYITDEVRRIRRSKLGNFAAQAVIWTTAAHLSGAYEKLGLENLDWIHQISKLRLKNPLKDD